MRLKIKDQIALLKEELRALLRSIFGVETNKAPLEVEAVFEESKRRVEESLLLQEIFEPKLQEYINSLNIPEQFRNIDFDSALELVQNDLVDAKDFIPILKDNLDNNTLKKAIQSSVPSTGNVLKELGQTLAHITGPAQKSPEFVRSFLTSDCCNNLDNTHIYSIIDPTFTNLEQPLRAYISSDNFIQEPEPLRNIITSGINLPESFSNSLLETDNLDEFISNFIQTADIAQLAPEFSNALLNNSFQQASPIMLELVASYLPSLSSQVRDSIGSGNLSNLGPDAIAFISHTKLGTITDRIRGYIDQVITKTPISFEVKNVIGRLIGEEIDLTDVIDTISSAGLSNVNLQELGLNSFTISELDSLFSSDLELSKLTRQLNKLNLSGFDNSAISQLFNQGITQGDLYKLGNILDRGFGGKLDKITDLIGSGVFGNSVQEIEGGIDQLKNSFLGLSILGTLDRSQHTDQIIKQLVQILPVGNQNLDDLLSRIGPIINQYTHVTLEKRGDLFTKATHNTQQLFPKYFRVRDEAGKQPKKKPYHPRSPLKKGEETSPGLDIPQVRKGKPEDGSLTH